MQRKLKILTPIAVSALLLIALELLLRARPEVLGKETASRLFNRYTTSPGGIYVAEPLSGIHLMWPSFETRAYSNGYFWHHRTDSRGFRNPEGLGKKGILLLGDSFVYGHGVEQEETAAYLLRQEHGLPAYNMARQGDSLYEEYVLYRLHAEELAPRVVILTVFSNDFNDMAWKQLPDSWYDNPPEIADFDYAAIRASSRSLLAKGPSRTARALAAASTVSATLALAAGALPRLAPGVSDGDHVDAPVNSYRALRDPGGKAVYRALAPPDMERPPFDVLSSFYGAVLDKEMFRRVAGYYALLLGDMSRRCRAQGSRLVVVSLDLRPPNMPQLERQVSRRLRMAMLRRTVASEERLQAAANNAAWTMGARRMVQDRIDAFLRDLTHELDIAYADTRQALWECGDCLLPGDGHLNAKGHRRLAGLLAGVAAGAGEPADPAPGGAARSRP